MNTSSYKGTDSDISETPLSNSCKLLKTEKKLTIGYLGGSITLGSSAEKDGGSLERSWVNLTSTWFKEQYHEAEIETVNAGVSDTATNFGLFRLGKTLMNTEGHDMPDLVFVEFTSNDWVYETQTEEDLRSQIESLFLNIWRYNPYVEIVVAVTARSEDVPSRRAYLSVAEHYNIPIVDVGIELQRQIEKRGLSKESEGKYYYTVDDLHPSWRGYEIYFNKIKRELSAYINEAKLKSNNLYPYGKHLPNALNGSLITAPEIITANHLTLSGKFVITNLPFTCNMYETGREIKTIALTDNYIHTNEKASVSATFSGTSLGILLGLNKSGVNMTYSIDDKAAQILKIDSENFSWQMYDHPQVFMLAHRLSEGKHKVKLIFSPVGTARAVDVTIGGLLSGN